VDVKTGPAISCHCLAAMDHPIDALTGLIMSSRTGQRPLFNKPRLVHHRCQHCKKTARCSTPSHACPILYVINVCAAQHTSSRDGNGQTEEIVFSFQVFFFFHAIILMSYPVLALEAWAKHAARATLALSVGAPGS
jgi:hypothetical protein